MTENGDVKERELVMGVVEIWKCGGKPSSMLHYLSAQGVVGLELIRIMKIAFPSLEKTKAISAWAYARGAGHVTDDSLDRRLAPYMPDPCVD